MQQLYILGDSKLVVDQVMKDAACQNPKMEAYCQEVKKLEDKFEGLELHHILQKDNQAADDLAKLTSSRGLAPDGIFVNDLHEPSFQLKPVDEACRGPGGQDARARHTLS